tara:strand:+ start:260 stop:391 length:132 start_codon:yes stop_codon:yes gene_type:complete
LHFDFAKQMPLKEIYDFVEKELNVLTKQLFRELKINPFSWALV